jgi:glycosyltransferase involved in cell wall biosynthesis
VSAQARPVAGSSFAIVANGFADGPAQALRDFLVEGGAHVVMVAHPLTPEQGRGHVVTSFKRGRTTSSRTTRTPFRPPVSFALDPIVPLGYPRVDVWFGFNPLAAARGLAQRRLGRAGRVVLWSVDFTPDRFGAGTLLTRLYDRLDRLGCSHADARVELSVPARDARNLRLGLAGRPPVHVVPMGAWLDRTPVAPVDGFEARRIVVLGHLTQERGTSALVDALALLRADGSQLELDVIGDGPELPALRLQAARLGVVDAVRFHGYVSDHRAVEALLAAGSVAAAPYSPSESTFTRWADPGKLKAYLAAGLPVVLTDVPPNAEELAREAGAEIAAYDPGALAAAIERVLESPEAWRRRRERALAYVRRFDWPQLLGDVLAKLGFAI